MADIHKCVCAGVRVGVGGKGWVRKGRLGMKNEGEETKIVVIPSSAFSFEYDY